MGIKEWFLIGRIIHLVVHSWHFLVDTINKYVNRIKWLYIYYIKKEQERKYIIDSRASKNVIYCDGHFMLVNEYEIFMLDDDDFSMQKGFTTSNSEYTDFSKAINSPCCVNNRFNSCVVNAQPLDKKLNALVRITDLKSEKDSLSFKIEIDARSRFESFKFGLYVAIPNEFTNRTNLDDTILITANAYGKFTLELKVDKDSEHLKYFAPSICINGKYRKPVISEDLFYENRKWNLIGLIKRDLGTIKITHKKEQ